MFYVWLFAAASFGASIMYVFAGAIGYSSGYQDGWSAAYGIVTDEDPAIGLGA